ATRSCRGRSATHPGWPLTVPAGSTSTRANGCARGSPRAATAGTSTDRMIVSNNSIAGPRILTVDIETSPNLGYFFSLWNQNMGLSQVETFTEVISFAAKWHDRKKVMFKSVYHDGKDVMVREAFDLLSAA